AAETSAYFLPPECENLLTDAPCASRTVLTNLVRGSSVTRTGDSVPERDPRTRESARTAPRWGHRSRGRAVIAQGPPGILGPCPRRPLPCSVTARPRRSSRRQARPSR